MSKDNNRGIKCPHCRLEGIEIFIVKQLSDPVAGSLCPGCGGGVVDVGGKLYVERSGKRLPT